MTAEVERRWRHERRMTIRLHHPDVGGSAVMLRAALHNVDRRHGKVRYPEVTRHVSTRSRRLHRAARLSRHASRWVRGWIPRRWPGARRYVDIGPTRQSRGSDQIWEEET